MSLAKDFQELLIWQRGHEIALYIYKITETFPTTEKFALVDQLRRAAVSVPSNIAEGFERESVKEFCHFLVIARGSIAEVRSQVILARDLGYISSETCTDFLQKSSELHKMLNSFKKSLERRNLE